MTAKDKKPAGFLIYVQDILSWLAWFAVKILSKLATPEEYATPQRNRLRISQGENIPQGRQTYADTHRRLPADMAGKKWLLAICRLGLGQKSPATKALKNKGREHPDGQETATQ